jgi:hypothetical protein
MLAAAAAPAATMCGYHHLNKQFPHANFNIVNGIGFVVLRLVSCNTFKNCS